MKILFLSLLDFKTLNHKSIYTDLLKQFVSNGHYIYAISPIEKRKNEETNLIEENGIKILRVSSGNIQKTNLIEKGISTLRLESTVLKAIKKYFNDVEFDLVLYPTPPITFEKVINYIKKRDCATSYLLLKDIFPQNAVDLGMFRQNRPFHKYFRSKEKRLYKLSDFIGCMSQANVDYVLKNNPEVNSSKVEICPNSTDPITIQNDKKTITNIRNKYNIPLDKIIFIYGGNLGKPQGIDFLMECLRSNKDNEQVHFVLAGSGTEFNKLQAFFNEEQPKNAQLFKQLPKEDYETLVNSCDVGLIFLDKRFTIPNFPSRLLSYMQASMPVLAATDVNTDIGNVIEEGEFGYWCESHDVKSFNDRLNDLCDSQTRKSMGGNARKYLENNYTSKQSYDIIMSHFK